jgi:hypothetical protein
VFDSLITIRLRIDDDRTPSVDAVIQDDSTNLEVRATGPSPHTLRRPPAA